MKSNLIERINLVLEKPLTPQQRRKRGRIMKRLGKKIARKRKLALKKKASKEKIEKRAAKQAKEILRSKILKNKKYDDLPFSARLQVDKKLDQKKALLKRITKKLIPIVRKKELQRLQSKNEK
jgi:ATP sulfurylase